MIKLNSSRILQAVMAGAVTTTAPSCALGYNDKSATAYDGDAKLTDLNGTTPVTICAAPSAGVIRQVDYLTLRNHDSATIVVTIRFNEGGTLTTVFVATLEPGEMVGFTHASGWYVCAADGSRKSGAVQDLSSYATTIEVAAGYQPLDSDLTTMAGLAPANDDFMQRKAGAWANRTPTQVKTDLALTKSDVGLGNVDNTSDVNKPVSTAQAAADAAVLSTAQTYADGLVVGLWDDRGTYDASGNVFPSTGGSGAAGAIKKGDIWTISVAGTLGGHAVAAGDTVRALVDTPGSTDSNWGIGENNIGYVPENAANKDATGGYAGLSGFSIKLKNALGTVTSFLASAATTARTWTFPDKDGTVAMTSDITGTNSGTNTGDQLVFKTISVSGQSDVVADTTTDTLTLAAGTNVTITTNASTDTVTITAAGGSPGGSNTQVQFNDSSAFGGDSGLTFNKTTKLLTIGAGITSTGAFDLNPNNALAVVRVAANGFYPTNTNTVDLGYASGGFSWKSLTLVGRIAFDNGGTLDAGLARSAAGVVEINSATPGTLRDLSLRCLRPQVFTVGTLQSASTQGNGARSHVSDGLGPTFGATVVGGGSVSTPVYSDASNWKVG